MIHRIISWLTVVLLAASFSHAQTAEEPKFYMGRQVAAPMHWMGGAWLLRNKRDREESAIRLREELQLKPGMVVCDMGSGNGYHTLPMAESVKPDGEVYAVDIQPEMLEMLNKRAEAAGASNIKTLLGTENDAKLPPASCDLILLVDVYHEFSDPEAMLKSMKLALKPGGQIVLVEFRAEDDAVPIKPEHKMSKEQINKELLANGWKLTRSFDELPWQHMMWFTPDDPER
jgi:cyclopropane fatty-acyl-phospholipid synthase-like methyltransferase